jgi:hypothetical protein
MLLRFVIPAEAGIRKIFKELGSRFRGSDMYISSSSGENTGE